MRKIFSTIIAMTLIIVIASNATTIIVQANSTETPTTLDPLIIPKWVNQLTGAPPVYVPTSVVKNSNGDIIQENYVVNVTQFQQQILPLKDTKGNPLGKTTVWGYGGIAKDATTGTPMGYVRNSPAPTFEATRNIKIKVTWINNLTDANGTPLNYLYAIDPTIHWANPNNLNMTKIMEDAMMGNAPTYPPGYDGSSTTNVNGWNAQSPVPIVTHLHGGETQSAYDGGPEQWFTPNGIHGPTYATAEPTYLNAAVYEYLNTQEPTTLWYHDHALGLTRINVFSGLAGFYLLRDPSDTVAASLPTGEYEVPLAIQDRSFLSDGSFDFGAKGVNSDHPYWVPEYFGDTIMVNGLVWPNMDVKQATYRFRVLDGSNARFYTLSLNNTATNTLVPFTQIGTDGGYLKSPLQLTSLTIAPGERVDILVNFTGISPGTKILVQNTAPGPYPNGDPVDPKTTGQILQFTVKSNPGPRLSSLPSILNPTLNGAFPNLPTATKTRTLTLTERMNSQTDASEALFLDGQKYDSPITELPTVGSTENWVIVDATADTHPIHLHLIQFQLVSRQPYNQTKYYSDWLSLNNATVESLPLDHPTANLPSLEPYYTGPTIGPDPNEQGWKDTVRMNPGEVTTIRVRFTAQDGSPFTFDATQGPGYVWHCHIIDHEDNEMMRPYKVVSAQSGTTPNPTQSGTTPNPTQSGTTPNPSQSSMPMPSQSGSPNPAQSSTPAGSSSNTLMIVGIVVVVVVVAAVLASIPYAMKRRKSTEPHK
jgi:spore coat protein A